MRNLLVTGGAGFIGANFVSYWLQSQADGRLVVFDALTYAGHLASLEAARSDPRFELVRGDIRDRELVEEVLRRREIDTIVHLAAESHVDRSIAGPDLFVEVNVGGTQSLLEAARAVWLGGAQGGDRRRRFHHVSTDEVYGSLGPDDPPFTESTPYAPSSPYAASKAAADHLVRAYHRTYGLPVTISNCSNNYGPYQFPEKLIPLCVVRLLNGRSLPVYGDGLNVRDWLHAEDHCRGIEAVLARGQVGETYNLGGRCERTNLEIVRATCRLVDALFEARPELGREYPDCPAASGEPCESRITFVRDRPGHDRRYAIDAGRAEEDLGFRAAIELDDGLRRTIEWYIDHRHWWGAVIDGSYREWIAEQYGADEA